MGHVPDWVRKDQSKTAKMADGGEVESGPAIQYNASSDANGNTLDLSARGKKSFDLEDGKLEVGMTARAFKARGSETKAGVGGVDATYRTKDKEFNVTVDRDPDGKKRYMAKFSKFF